MKENTNSMLWYVCKFCRRAFQQPRDLVRHKKAEHLDRILADKKVKKLQKNNAASSTTVALDRSEGSEESAENTDDVGGDTAEAQNAGIVAKRDEDDGGDTERTEDIGKPTEKNKKVKDDADNTEYISGKNTDGTDSSNSSVTAENEQNLCDTSASSTSENSFESEKEGKELESETSKNSESSKSSGTAGDSNSRQADSDDTSSSLDEFQTYKCPTCFKMCASERSLALHIKCTHAEETSYTCNYCSKTCTSERTLGLHVQFVHTKENTYPCNYCSMSFSHPRSRSCHIAKDHVDELCKSALSGRSSGKRVVEKVLDCCAKDKKRVKISGKPEMNRSPDEVGNDCSSSTKTSAAVSRKNSPPSNVSMTSNTYNCPTCNKRFLSKRKYQVHQSYHRRNPKEKEKSVSDLDETLPIEFSARTKKCKLRGGPKTMASCKR